MYLKKVLGMIKYEAIYTLKYCMTRVSIKAQSTRNLRCLREKKNCTDRKIVGASDVEARGKQNPHANKLTPASQCSRWQYVYAWYLLRPFVEGPFNVGANTFRIFKEELKKKRSRKVEALTQVYTNSPYWQQCDHSGDHLRLRALEPGVRISPPRKTK